MILAGPSSGQSGPAAPVLTDLDREIWEHELEGFVPRRVFDVHTHIYLWEHCLEPQKERGPYAPLLSVWPEASWAALDACDAALMPGRAVERLAFPFPLPPPVDFAAANAYVAQQTAGRGASAALMLVAPALGADELEATIEQYGLLGLKPYRTYAASGDATHCRITDFLPEHQIAVAERRGLLIMLHLSRPRGIADELNLTDLERLQQAAPRVRWILAHCARSYSAWAIDRAAARLRNMPQVWFDTSSVCESDAIDALYQAVGHERIMYGSDDLPVGVLRGKYVAFGHAWAWLSETNHALRLEHCDPRMTFTRYEQLRAMARVARRLRQPAQHISDLFYNTARGLLDYVRAQQVV